MLNAVASSGGAFDVAYATAVVTSGLFCAAFLAFLHHADRWERTPAALALAAFIGGGLAATFAIAIVGNAALSSLYTKAFGQAWAVDWQAGLTAPFVEETAKGAIFVLLLGLAPVVIRTAADGLIVGAYVGLGFQILEDILYAQNSAYAAFGAHQADAVLSLFVLRAITGIPSHALYTALFGAGVIYALGTTAQPRRLGRGIALMLSAVVIHGLWDSASAIGGPLLRRPRPARRDRRQRADAARRDPLGRAARAAVPARHHGAGGRGRDDHRGRAERAHRPRKREPCRRADGARSTCCAPRATSPPTSPRRAARTRPTSCTPARRSRACASLQPPSSSRSRSANASG